MADIDSLHTKFSEQIAEAGSLKALDDIRVAALGKKGEVSLKMRELGKM